MIWRRTKPSASEAEKPKGFDDFEIRLGDLMRGERATLGKSLLDVQRELKIKATYIAAIENCDISAFETPGFVAGYVRSYSRYLGMDPDESFRRFCAEANFEVAHGMSAAASTAAVMAVRSRSSGERREPLGDPNASFVPRTASIFAEVQPAAVGSLLVLVALIAAIGYGGWSVLQEVQRVQLGPVDQAPSVVAEIDPIGNIDGQAPLVRSAPEATSAVADAGTTDALADRPYRPGALDTPVMVPRDGPIASIDPRQTGAFAPGGEAAVEDAVASALETATTDAVQVLETQVAAVELLAVRPSWIRVSSPDGTSLFEGTLDAGQTYVVPQLEDAALLRSGNAGAVYVMINGDAYGPVGPGGEVVKNIPLSKDTLVTTFSVADIAADEDLARAVAVADASDVTGAADPGVSGPSE
jgi:cytoskeletal protein RodZ